MSTPFTATSPAQRLASAENADRTDRCRRCGVAAGRLAGRPHHEVLDQAQNLLRERWRLAHATVQIEPDGHLGGAVFDWCGSRDVNGQNPAPPAASPGAATRGRHRRG